MVESQLLGMKEHRERAAAEEAYRTRLKSVKILYASMKSKGTTALPPLGVFLELPSIRSIRGRSQPGAAPIPPQVQIPTHLDDDDLVTSLVKSDVSTWVSSARTELLKELGFPDGWKSASSTKLDPLHRITAKFLCTRCVDGGISERTKRQGCLDFLDVCSHVCRSTKRNTDASARHRIDGSGAQEEDDSDGAEIEDTQGATAKKRKKKRVHELKWRADVFRKDDKVHSVVDT